MLNKCNGNELNIAQHLNVDRNEQQLQILIATGKLIQTNYILFKLSECHILQNCGVLDLDGLTVHSSASNTCNETKQQAINTPLCNALLPDPLTHGLGFQNQTNKAKKDKMITPLISENIFTGQNKKKPFISL